MKKKDAHDVKSYERLVALAGETARVHAIADQGPALALVEEEEWSFGWEGDFLKEAQGLRASLEKLREVEKVLANALGLRTDESLAWRRRADVRALAPRASEDALDLSGVPDLPPSELVALAEDLAEDVDAYFAAKSESDATYSLKTIRRMPVEDLDDRLAGGPDQTLASLVLRADEGKEAFADVCRQR